MVWRSKKVSANNEWQGMSSTWAQRDVQVRNMASARSRTYGCRTVLVPADTIVISRNLFTRTLHAGSYAIPYVGRRLHGRRAS